MFANRTSIDQSSAFSNWNEVTQLTDIVHIDLLKTLSSDLTDNASSNFSPLFSDHEIADHNSDVTGHLALYTEVFDAGSDNRSEKSALQLASNNASPVSPNSSYTNSELASYSASNSEGSSLNCGGSGPALTRATITAAPELSAQQINSDAVIQAPVLKDVAPSSAAPDITPISQLTAATASVVVSNLSPAQQAAANTSYSTSSYPYDCVCYITDTIGGKGWQGTGFIIGPHTVLTAAHVLWQSGIGGGTNIEVYPGYSNGGTAISGSYQIHYYQINDSNDLINQSNSQYDFAVIDFAKNLSSFGSFGLQTNYTGGTVHLTGYPASAGGAQTDQTGQVSLDPSYSVLDYGSVAPSPGNSGGPLWFYQGTSPYAVGVVSTTGWAVQLTSADLQTIQGWEASDSYLWAASTPATVSQEIAGLYVTLYGLAATQAGINYWTNVVSTFDPSITAGNAGSTAISLNDEVYLGQQMTASSPVVNGTTYFQTLYPSSMTDLAYVKALYQNMSGFIGTAAGDQYWLNVLQQSEAANAGNPNAVTLAREAIVGQFTHDFYSNDLTVGATALGVSASDYASLVAGQQTLHNKATVAQYWATETGVSGGAILNFTSVTDPSFAAAQHVLAGITSDPNTVTVAITGIAAAVAQQNLGLV